MLTPAGLGAPRRHPNWRFLLPLLAVTVAVIAGSVWFFAGRNEPEPQNNTAIGNTTTSTRSQTSAPTAAPATKTLPPLKKPLQPIAVDVNVYNASPRSGLAVSTADALTACRFHVLAYSNDPLGSDGSAAALIRYGRTGLTSAQTLQLFVPGAQLLQDKRTNSTVDLVLGNGFSALAPPAWASCH